MGGEGAWLLPAGPAMTAPARERPRSSASHAPAHPRVGPTAPAVSRFSQLIGRSRFIVLLAVTAVMLVAVSLFLLGTLQAIKGIYHAWEGVLRGETGSTELTIEFLEIVSVMLKAVVFYLIGVGFYSLFVAPLNITVSLGVQTLSDLESKVVDVVVVILGITFLEHFVLWEKPTELLQFGAAMAVVVLSLVLFQRYAHQAKEDQKAHHPDEQARAQRALFEHEEEQAEIVPAQVDGTARGAPGDDGQPR